MFPPIWELLVKIVIAPHPLTSMGLWCNNYPLLVVFQTPAEKWSMELAGAASAEASGAVVQA